MRRHYGPDFDRFLREVLPDLGLIWNRHRRKGVRRKLAERMRFLGQRSLADYKTLLDRDPGEKGRLALLLGVTISRFFREVDVFEHLAENIWPSWTDRLKIVMFSAGCASGEEPYSLAILWREYGPPGARAVILALDMDRECLDRARRGLYPSASLREIPLDIRNKYFTNPGGPMRLDASIKEMVGFFRGDLRKSGPPPGTDLIMCRNLVYTYFDSRSRELMTEKFALALAPGGLLVVGATETVNNQDLFQMVHPCIYQKT